MRDITPAHITHRGIGWKSAWWLLALFGGVATFLGLFILFGSEDEYVGLGGDLAWRVGDISSVWTYGLLIGGLALLGILAAVTIIGRDMGPVTTTPLQDLMFHAGVFVLVNAFIWAQDYALGTGLDYALWVTIPWGVGLLIHAITVVTAGAATKVEHRTDEDAERPREPQLH